MWSTVTPHDFKNGNNINIFSCKLYCRVLPGSATNNLWVLNLTLGLLEYSPGRITGSFFTVLQHINFTVKSSVRRLFRPPLNWFLLSTNASLSTDLTFHCWLSLSSVSDPLKLTFYRPEREHPVQPFNFLHLLLAYSLPRNLTVKASVSMVTTYYIRVSDAAVISVFISAETETSSNCRRCLTMDVLIDSYNPPLCGTPQYFYLRINKRL
jgi:hypothetical protein